MKDRYLHKAKRVDNGEWVKGYLIYSFTGVPIIVTEYDHILMLVTRYEVRPDTICQCTGLKDKNGTLIWENDIMKYEWCRMHRVDVVKYDPPMFTYSEVVRWNLGIDEVIGNIFDNPELLESEI